MKKYFMIWLRFSLEVFLTIALFPTILTVSGIWLKNPTRLYRGFHWSLLEIDYTIKNTYYDEVI